MNVSNYFGRKVFKMKKEICLILCYSLMLAGCVRSSNNNVETLTNKTEAQYKTKATIYSIDKNNLLIGESSGLAVVDVVNNKVIKQISAQGKLGVKPADISGDIVVWSDRRNEKDDTKYELVEINSDIFTYNIKTDEEKQITRDTSAQTSPKMWNNYVIYADSRNDTSKSEPGRWSLYLYNLDTSEEKLISSTLANSCSYGYSIKDNKIVWEDDRDFMGDDILRSGSNVPENNKDIYLYDISSGKETVVAAGDKMESNPDISGDYIVYEDRNNGSLKADIVLYNIKSKKKINITEDEYNQGTPKIFGDYIAWMDEKRGSSTNDVIDNGRFPNSDIFIYNIKSKKMQMLDLDEPQVLPYITAQWLVYTTSRQIDEFSEIIRYK
jgi:beta propeller repeat protein